MENSSYLRRTEAAHKQWLNEWNWQQPVAITLTCKRSDIKNPETLRERLEQNMHYFLNFLCKKMRVRRKYLQVLVVKEGGLDNPHYHLTLDLPGKVTLDVFAKLVRQCWLKTKWGDQQILVQECWSADWLGYCLKLRSKRDGCDGIDTKNTNRRTIDL